MNCEWCHQTFKETDEVVDSEFGLMHENECFIEYCRQNFGGRSYSYAELRALREEETKELNDYTNKLPNLPFCVKVYDFQINVLATDGMSALQLAIKKSPYANKAIPSDKIVVETL